ncbi:GIY-YIG nuclease family protein [Bosea sp. RAF48]|uniref:GIY-YIG nuclease family protein n=1 Tax=Bosea sp. RAF48 TaxID=3237480 RepID=UPI003F90F9D3
MQKQDGCWLYIVECSDGSRYTGTTRGEVETRIDQHNAGVYPDSYTFVRRPVSLVFAEHFPSILDAIAMERRVKGWSRRKKQAMIDGHWERLPELARRRT